MPDAHTSGVAVAGEPRSRRVAVADGLSLNILDWDLDSKQAGVPLLLVHGFSNEAHIWDDFAPLVAPYYRTLAIDLRGHGDSDWHPDGAYTLPDLVADLEAVVESEGFERFVLVGHSLGGRVSMLYAGKHPHRLAGLVLVDSGPEHDPRGTLRIQLDVGKNRDPSFASVSDFAETCAHLYPAAAPEAIQRMARHGVSQRDDGRWALKMDPRYRSFGASKPSDLEAREGLEPDLAADLWAALQRVTCATLVVRGAASDILSPHIADKMVDDVLEDGRLAVVGRAGHSVMTDNPSGFGEAVCGFVLG